MALNAPNKEVLQRTDLLFGPLPREAVIPPERFREDDAIRRAEEKEGANYLVYFEGAKRVIFDQFLISSWQKNVNDIAVPQYTRGQPVIEVFGSGQVLVQVELKLFDSRTTVEFLDANRGTGYVGSSIKEFVKNYDRYFRGSAGAKKDAFAALNVKGRRDYGYLTQFAFDRVSPNDYEITCSFSFWSFFSEIDDVGKTLAEALIARTASPGAIQVDIPEDQF